MICNRCVRRSLQLRCSQTPRRSFSLTPDRRASKDKPAISPNTTSTAQGRQPSGAPSATSTSAAQPFSTPLTPSPKSAGIKGTPTTSSKPDVAAPPPPKSSVLAGTPLQGLGYLKSRQDPLAMEDHEYPDWLWTCLESGKSGKEEAAATRAADIADLYSNSTKARQAASRRMRKQEALNAHKLAPDVPVHERSTDLKWNDDSGNVEGTREAREAREEVTGALRSARRQAIKQSNFLKSMK
ncbi:MAG: hypothetical protein M4579_005898 [Chaenotheca gracillima]|nr:MAG: hypothetical protein M4579_005898 [Chaenotheca gracillima]